MWAPVCRWYLQPRLEVGDGISIGCNHGHRVGWCDEELLPQNHVPVTIAIRGSAKVRALVTPAQVDQLLGIGQVGVRVAAPKVFLGNAIPANAMCVGEGQTFQVSLGGSITSLSKQLAHNRDIHLV